MPIKENRRISLSPRDGYLRLDQIEWAPERLQHGVEVKLKEVPFKVQLFKGVATNGDIEWVITNRAPRFIDTRVVRDENKVRWARATASGTETADGDREMPMPQAAGATESFRVLLSGVAFIEGDG